MKNLDHPRPVLSITYAADGRTLFSGDACGTVRTWDLFTGESRAVLQHTASIPPPVVSLTSSRDGRWLAVGCGSALLCQVGAPSAGLEGPPSSAIRKTSSRWLWASHWDLRPLRGSPDDLAFSPDSKLLACIVWPRLQLWDVDRSRWGQSLGQDLLLTAPTFAPRGHRLAALAKGKGGYSILLWDYARETVETLDAAGCNSRPLFSPDGRWLAVAGVSGVDVHDCNSRTRVSLPKPTQSHVRLMAFSPDGTRLVTGTRENTIRLWDVITRKMLAEWDWKIGRVNGLAFAPDGMTAAAAGSNCTVVIWDMDQ
jgi:WD40 repeat protein